MTQGVRTPRPLDSRAPWTDLLGRHRRAWASEALRDWTIVDLAAAEDPAAALAAASDRTAFLWLDGYLEADDRDRVRANLEQAARRGAPIVIGFEFDGDGFAQRESERLRGELDGAQVVTQELAAGSLIHAVVDPGDATTRGRSVHALVCGNLDVAGTQSPSTELGSEIEPLMTGYVAWLERANRELRIANTRLGRERLGVHDAAAAAVEDLRARLQKAEEDARAAEHERGLYVKALENAEAALLAPRYRFVDSLRDRAFGLPGVSLVLRLRSARVRRRFKS